MCQRPLPYLTLYLVLAVTTAVTIHEASHVVTATVLGVPLADLKFGFRGINPSVTLPQWLDEQQRTVVFYAGGLTTGVLFLLGYLLYWIPAYRRQPSTLHWLLGLTTVTLAAGQLASGYLEGRYHDAYIAGAMTIFSTADLLTYGWMVAAVLIHFSLCPRRTRVNKS